MIVGSHLTERNEMYGKDEWIYKGYTCSVDMDIEPEEVRKAWHNVTSPEGQFLRPSITPYDDSRIVVEMWIDAGCPVFRCQIDGVDCGNWDRRSLQLLIDDRLTMDNLREVWMAT